MMPPKHRQVLLSQDEGALLDFPSDFEDFLFNQPVFWKSKLFVAEYSLWIFALVKTNSPRKLLAKIHFFIRDSEAISPLQAPFGHFAFGNNIRFDELVYFIQQIEQHLRAKGIKRILTKSYPDAYQPSLAALMTQALLQEGYLIKEVNLNQHLIIKSSDDFMKDLHLSERRRLNKSLKENFQASLWENPDLERVHDFIVKARQRKGFPISLNRDEFEYMFEQMPEYYQVHVVWHQAQIAALTVTVKINRRILYNFYPADTPEYLSYSPIVLLNAHLYEFAYQQGFQLLDLGISTEAGKANYGLIHFKHYLGASNSLKLQFEKSL